MTLPKILVELIRSCLFPIPYSLLPTPYSLFPVPLKKTIVWHLILKLC
ncbi:hypothetical protein [Moorena sp. SIO3H5]|nr:hypothetical protein [Moorena sp. SIO3H5]NEO71813.1 hypothetical protein [Moorena sp. SIO3H5]